METPIDQPVTKIKKPRKRKVKKARTPAAPKPTTQFAGMTVTECCKACNADGCVISGRAYCAHPRKGGLQGAHLLDQEAVGRLNAARKSLARADADKRFS